MKWLTLLTVLWLGLHHSPAQATCTAGLIGMPPLGPKTFSGTSCSVLGWVSTDIGYITDAAIYVGGERIKYVGPSSQTTYFEVSAVFDSTHFSHDSSVYVEVVGHNNQGQEGRSLRIFNDKIYNKGSAFGHTEFENIWMAFEAVIGHLTAMNHAITPHPDSGWTTQNVLNSVKVDTALHYSTHATPTQMQNDAGGWISYTQVQSTRQQQRTAPVDINLVFLNGCESWSSQWAGAFGITDSSFNRAYLGWDDIVDIYGAQHAAHVFWQQLREGKTVSTARQEAADEYWETKRGYPEAYLAVIGDYDTKLHGVYGMEGTDWYR